MKRKLFVILSCMLIAIGVWAEEAKTIDVTFSNYPTGTQYADNEEHVLSEELTIYTTDCFFTEQLRIYSSTTYNGFVISAPLSGPITEMTFNAAYEKGGDILEVYGSTDSENWTLVKSVNVDYSFWWDYKVSFQNYNFTYFKLDVKGNNQLRIKSMSVTYVSDDNNNGGNEGGSDEGDNEGEGNEGDNGGEGSENEKIEIILPTFSPYSTTFDTEMLNVSIRTTEGCDIYYTTDGTTPSYTDANSYNGTKGNEITIYASEAPVTLKAIAVNPATGECSDISRAAYFYTAPSVPDDTPESSTNDGSINNPYTVVEVKNITPWTASGWVKGTIYGAMTKDISTTITTNINTTTNIVIGDENNHIPIQLTDNEDIKAKINLVEHPYFRGKELLIEGKIGEYGKSSAVTSPTNYKITYEVPINRFGYATLYLDMPAKVPTGSTAYYCTTDNDIARLTPIEGNIIPDSVGVILESESNTTCTLTYTTEKNDQEESIIAQNQLVGFATDSVVFMESNAYYALNSKDGKLGFYKPQNSIDGVFVAKAYKAYLQIPTEQNVSAFVIHRENDETKIVHITHMSEDIIYDLQGRAVTHPTPGIYIRGGRKIIIQ